MKEFFASKEKEVTGLKEKLKLKEDKCREYEKIIDDTKLKGLEPQSSMEVDATSEKQVKRKISKCC